jgi:hypothetical protein
VNEPPTTAQIPQVCLLFLFLLQQELSRRLSEQVLSRPECAAAYGAALGSPSFASLGTEEKAQVYFEFTRLMVTPSSI